jgi:hypothetical protein
MTLRRILGVGGVIVVIASATWAVAQGGHQHEPHNVALQRLGRTWETLVARGRREAPPAHRQHWPFAKIVAASGGMPEALRAEAEEALGDGGRLGLRFGQARYGATPGGVGLWVVPGDGVTCMFRSPSIAAACRTTAQAYRNGIVLQTYKLGKSHHGRPKSFAALGIAPDGLRFMALEIGKRRTSIPLHGNVYLVESRSPIAVLPPRP